MRGLGLGFTNPLGPGEVLNVCLCLCYSRVGGEWVGDLDQDLDGVNLDFMSIWQVQVQVSVYCSWRIPAHLRCTRFSIRLHIMDICSLPCICLKQISRLVCVWLSDLHWSRHHPLLCGAAPSIQRVRMTGLPKNCKSGAFAGAGDFDTICTYVCNRYDRSTACMLCRLEPGFKIYSFTHK